MRHLKATPTYIIDVGRTTEAGLYSAMRSRKLSRQLGINALV